MSTRSASARDLSILGLLIAVVAAIVVGGALLHDRDATSGARAADLTTQENQSAPEPAATEPDGFTAEYGLLLGEPDAPHKVVIYEDFLCPFCGLLETSGNEVLQTAIDEGRASVEYRPIDLLSRMGDYSKRSTNAFAVVLDVAGPDVAKDFHDALYEEQPAEEPPFPDDAWLIEQAVAAGADEDAVTGPIESLQFGDWVTTATEAAFANGVTGTPTLLVDGEPVSGSSIDELVANLEATLAQ